METSFLINLLLEVQEYEHSKSFKNHATIEDFRIWLNEKKYTTESPTKLFKKMIRKGLSDFPTLANEEFTYLYRLKDEPSLTKMQLIERNGHEKQTGIQIIKRLLDDGLIQETVDENDKRAKRLTLTKKGEEAFHQSVEKVNTTSRILSANLKSDEKTKLLELLKKVNDFHYTLYTEYKNSEIKELLHLIE